MFNVSCFFLSLKSSLHWFYQEGNSSNLVVFYIFISSVVNFVKKLKSAMVLIFMNMFLLGLGTQDLKNLRAQLYSAAEYFELSYTDDDQKHMYISLTPLQYL